ncbi:MAG: glycosyltransferase family 4 protein [Pseudanabaenales cyanobacterium]|nr:glycosyltransferase family 4 protein [Pseudanabaenales cyanobacterium]
MKRHGQVIRTTETEEVERLEREDLNQFQANVLTAAVPKRSAAWPSELNGAIVVCPSLNDTIPMVIGEAMACERPP